MAKRRRRQNLIRTMISNCILVMNQVRLAFAKGFRPKPGARLEKPVDASHGEDTTRSSRGRLALDRDGFRVFSPS